MQQVEDISNEPHVERELMLIKLNADTSTCPEVTILYASLCFLQKNNLNHKINLLADSILEGFLCPEKESCSSNWLKSLYLCLAQYVNDILI